MLVKFIISVILTIYLASCEKFRYDDYALYKIHPQDEEALQFLHQLYQENEDLNFWKPPSRLGEYVSVVSPPEIREEFEHSLSKRSIHSEVVLENIQEAFDAQLYSRRKRDTRNQMYWTNYQTMDEINDWFYELAETYSSIASVVVAGETHEGRNITGIRISRGSSRSVFIITGGEIGADWLSPTVITYIVDQLVRGEDPQALAASQDFEWYIFPAINVDGQEFTQNSVRAWIKNRRPTTSSTIGVDLSRNFNAQWGVNGASFTPTADNYVGLGPFSEPETRDISRFIEDFSPRIVGFLNFRSFGQRVLIPFSHTSDHLYNYDEMVFVARRAVGALSVTYNTQYQVGNSAEVSDGATGNIADWVKHRFNPPVVLTYLLRDTGSWGYTLPVIQVEPSCIETFDSVMAVIREAQFVNIL